MADLRLAALIVTLNHEGFISQCIHSLIREMPNDSEIYIFDLGSDDRTAQIAHSVSVTNPRVQLKQLPSGTTSLQALRHAACSVDVDYIVGMSGDDFVLPGYGRVVSDALSTCDTPTVYCFGLHKMMPNGKTTVISPRWTGNPPDDRKKLLLGNPGTGPGALIPWKIVRGEGLLNCLPDSLIEDYCLWWLLHQHAHFRSITTVAVAYRIHGRNLSQANHTREWAFSLGVNTGLAWANSNRVGDLLRVCWLALRWSCRLSPLRLKSFVRGVQSGSHYWSQRSVASLVRTKRTTD